MSGGQLIPIETFAACGLARRVRIKRSLAGKDPLRRWAQVIAGAACRRGNRRRVKLWRLQILPRFGCWRRGICMSLRNDRPPVVEGLAAPGARCTANHTTTAAIAMNFK
jgi:hypothetical protein